MQNFCVGHVDFMLFIPFHFCWVANFQWNMGFKVTSFTLILFCPIHMQDLGGLPGLVLHSFYSNVNQTDIFYHNYHSINVECSCRNTGGCSMKIWCDMECINISSRVFV